MDIKEFAVGLDGVEYGYEFHNDGKRAKDLGFVIVFGYSDDNTEFEGAIKEEAGSYEGATIYLDEIGIFEECGCECSHSVFAKEKCKTIKAVWHDEGPIAWTYETDIPHATFDILEDGEVWCRGIVFNIKSLRQEIEHKEIAGANLMRLRELVDIYVAAGVLKEEFEAFTDYEEPISTIEELIEQMEIEMSYWEPEGE